MPDQTEQRQSAWTVFLVFLRLGLTSFGGPVAHLAYFRTEFVDRRKWLSEARYADIVALCQFLPGPASSQAGLAIGLLRGGYGGALAAWAGFTLPSALALVLFAFGLSHFEDGIAAGALGGLKIAAVAVVAQAVWGMARTLCPDVPRITLMAVATVIVVLYPTAAGQVGVIAAAALVGRLMCRPDPAGAHGDLPVTIRPRAALLWLGLFFLLLIGLPLAAVFYPDPALKLFDAFYRAGALVFGGGHVVLPLLQAEVVPPGWVSNDSFLAGYGAAQAVPGPLFTFAAYLGAAMDGALGGWRGAALALTAIFAPSFLLVFGVLPFWDRLRIRPGVRAALAGVNAAVVGLLLAALYTPVWTSAIHGAADFALAVIALVALIFWRLPPWLVVMACGAAGWIIPGVG